MGAWVALVLIAAGGPAVLETRYFDSSAECEAWARRITTPPEAATRSRGASMSAS